LSQFRNDCNVHRLHHARTRRTASLAASRLRQMRQRLCVCLSGYSTSCAMAEKMVMPERLEPSERMDQCDVALLTPLARVLAGRAGLMCEP